MVKITIMENNNEQLSTKSKKKAMLSALEKSLGVVTTALRSTGVGRTAYYEWLKEDAEFKAKVDAVPDIALDFAESKLHKLIDDGVPSATIFYLKTKGKDRGYVERQEINANVKNETIVIDLGQGKDEPNR